MNSWIIRTLDPPTTKAAKYWNDQSKWSLPKRSVSILDHEWKYIRTYRNYIDRMSHLDDEVTSGLDSMSREYECLNCKMILTISFDSKFKLCEYEFLDFMDGYPVFYDNAEYSMHDFCLNRQMSKCCE